MEKIDIHELERLAAERHPDRPALIAALHRELGMRRRVYPRWVQEGRMNKTEAAHELACFRTMIRLAEGGELF